MKSFTKTVMVLFLFVSLMASSIAPLTITTTNISPQAPFNIAAGEGWLLDWDFRKSLSISSATGAGTNYTVQVDVSFGSWASSFVEDSKSGVSMNATQGVATNGTHFFTTSAGVDPPYNNSFLMTYDSAFNLLNSRNCSEDVSDSFAQINHVYWHSADSRLYVGASNYDNATKRSYILEYDTELNLIECHDIKNGTSWIQAWTEGAGYYDGYWWVVYTDAMVVDRFDASWDYVDEFELTADVDLGPVSAAGYQAPVWIDDYMYTPIHGAGEPDEKVDVYRFDGSAMVLVARIDTPIPEYTQQGFCKSPTNDTTYWAIRNGVDHSEMCIANMTRTLSDIDTHGNAQSDFDDIRFTEDDGATELYYFMDGYAAAGSARFWVRVSDDLSISDVIIYVYYGNAAVSTTSDGENTFTDFFDDFDRTDNETVGNGWTEDNDSGGKTNITNNELMINCPENYYSHIEKAAPALSDFALHGRIYADPSEPATWGTRINAYWDSYDWAGAGWASTTPLWWMYRDVAGTVTNDYVIGGVSGVWYYYAIKANSSHVTVSYSLISSEWSDIIDYSRPGSWSGAASLIIVGKGHADSGGGTYPNADMDNSFSSGGSTLTSYADSVFMRKYVSSEPEVYSSGEEEGEGPQWEEIGEAEFIFPVGWDPVAQFGFDMFFITLGLIMIPASTMYLVRGGRKEMSTDKVFFGFILFLFGIGLVIGGVMP